VIHLAFAPSSTSRWRSSSCRPTHSTPRHDPWIKSTRFLATTRRGFQVSAADVQDEIRKYARGPVSGWRSGRCS
jgi:hypothetical protein